jgi:hypothetical protein
MQTTSIAFRRIGGQEELDKGMKEIGEKEARADGGGGGGEATATGWNVAQKTHEIRTGRICSS